jgi:hypothetical protein
MMVERYRPKRRIMREFNIEELSAVDRPAQEHAKMTIMKRDDETSQDIDKGDTEMTADEKKQVADLQKSVADLTKQLEAATKASDDSKTAVELQEQLTAATTKAEEAAAELEKTKAEAAEAAAEAATLKALSEMDAPQREYFDTLDKGGKDKFMEMTEDERKKSVKKSLDGDETVEVAGRVVRKSVVGEDQFAIFKAQQEQIDKQAEDFAKQEKTLAEERERRANAEFAKRADDELTHLPGTTEEKIPVFKALSEMDEDARKALETMLKAGDKAISAAFRKIGHGGGEGVPDASAFKAKVAEIKKRDECSQNDALAKARDEFPEEFKAYQNVSASN